MAEAKCLELLGNREKAIETYKKVARDHAATHPDMAKEAASRASDLEQPEAADFYKWLSEFKAPASKATIPSPGESMFPPPEDTGEKPAGSDDSAAATKDEKGPEGKAPESKASEGEPEAKKSDDPKPAADTAKEEKPDPQ